MNIERSAAIIESYHLLPLAEVLAKEGLDPTITELVLCSGDSKLTMWPEANEYMQSTSAVLPARAPEEIVTARAAICANCDSIVDGKCGVAGCSCAGLGNPGALFSKCPRDLWPPNPVGSPPPPVSTGKFHPG